MTATERFLREALGAALSRLKRALKRDGYRPPSRRPAANWFSLLNGTCVQSAPPYGVHTGPASVKNVALSENHPLTPTEGAP
jgi:hypothetical protein